MALESLETSYTSQQWWDARNYLSLAALLLLTLDLVTSCRSEYQYVWGARFTPTKFIYMWARYFALTAVIVHYSFIHVFLARGPVSAFRCKAWFLFLTLTCTTLQVCFDGLMLIRVYVLYRKSWKVVTTLTIPVLLQFVTAYVLVGRNALRDEDFNEKCDLRRTPIEAVPLGAVVFLAHFALWLTTFMKRNIVQGNNTTVMDTLVNTGNWSFSILSVISIMAIAYCFATRTVNPVIIFVLPATLISLTSCKMVINMRRLKFESTTASPIDSEDFVLTTFISTSFE